MRGYKECGPPKERTNIKRGFESTAAQFDLGQGVPVVWLGKDGVELNITSTIMIPKQYRIVQLLNRGLEQLVLWTGTVIVSVLD